MTITGSSIVENHVYGVSTGYGRLTVTDSTIAENDDSGLYIENMGAAETKRSVLWGNGRGAPARGGGILVWNFVPTIVELENGTIHDNRATVSGGGLDVGHGTVFLNNITITRITAPDGGGIHNADTLSVGNSILASNVGGNSSGSIASLEYDIDDGTTCGLSAAGDQSPTTIPLGPPADNGGPTFTRALLPGSPAIDAANDATAPPTDQRYILRPQGPHSDIGAFEVISEDAIPTPTPTGRRTPEGVTRTPPLSPILFDPVEFSSEILYKGHGCEPLTLTIRVHITPPEGVDSVGLFYRLVAKEGGSSFPWSEGLAMSPQGNGCYELTLIGDDLPNINEWQSGAWLDIQFVANGPEGEPIAWSEVICNVVYAMCQRSNNNRSLRRASGRKSPTSHAKPASRMREAGVFSDLSFGWAIITPLCGGRKRKEAVMKIGIVGSGLVGATAAYAMVMRGVGREIVLVDKNARRAQAEADDILHAVPFAHPLQVRAGDYSDLAGCRVAVITAGTAQKPGETRMDLLTRNAAIVSDVVPNVLEHAPRSVLLMVTNPVDVMTHTAAKSAAALGIPSTRVIGSGTALDTARFRALLGRHLGVDPGHVHAYVVGEHGDSEVLTWSIATVGGLPIEEFCRERNTTCLDKDRSRIDESVRRAAYRIIEGKGATYYGIGSALARITEAILRDQRSILTVCTPMAEVAGVKDVTVSLPHLVGGEGILDTFPLALNEEEQALLGRSAAVVGDAIRSLEK